MLSLYTVGVKTGRDTYSRLGCHSWSLTFASHAHSTLSAALSVVVLEGVLAGCRLSLLTADA